MTIVHLGFISKLTQEVQKWNSQITSHDLEGVLGRVILNHQTTLPRIDEVVGDHLGTMGGIIDDRKRVVLLLRSDALGEEFMVKRQQLVEALRDALHEVGVGDVEAFLNESKQMNHLNSFDPHVSIGRTGAENPIPDLPVSDLKIKLEPPAFTHVAFS